MKLLERKREREETQNKCLSVCLRLPTTRARMMNGWILSHVQRPLLDPGGYTHTQVQTHRPSGVIPHWPHALQLPTLGTESIHCRHQKILLPQIRKGKWRQMTSCRLLSPEFPFVSYLPSKEGEESWCQLSPENKPWVLLCHRERRRGNLKWESQEKSPKELWYNKE